MRQDFIETVNRPGKCFTIFGEFKSNLKFGFCLLYPIKFMQKVKAS